jgi:hypothetical protein
MGLKNLRTTNPSMMRCSKCNVVLDQETDNIETGICIDCEEEDKLLGLVSKSNTTSKNMQKTQIKKFKNQDY